MLPQMPRFSLTGQCAMPKRIINDDMHQTTQAFARLSRCYR